MKRLLLFISACAVALFVAAPAFADTGVTLFGSATQESADVKIVSDASTAATTDDAGGIQVPVASGTTLSSISALSAQYQLVAGDCGGGSPRFQLNIGGHNVFVYLGSVPNFTGCTANTWLDSGNLATSTDVRVDTSQFTRGKQYSTWAEAVTLLGSQAVTGIQFVVDAGWSQPGKVQTVLVRSITLNGTTFSLAQTTTPPPTTGGKVNPAKFCSALRAKMGSSAFNELWGTNANAKNGFGKCVSTVAHARNGGKTAQQITDAVTACTAKGLKGSALGSCVAAKDGVAATKTEAQEHADADDASHATGKGHGKKK